MPQSTLAPDSQTRDHNAPGQHVFALTDDEIQAMHAYWRAVNFLAGAQIYLQDNCLLSQPLRPEHIKPRLLGHWGTTPGLNFIYTHLNRLIRHRNANLLLITGPGHGAPANLSNLFLEGSLEEYYPTLSRDAEGVAHLIRMFSWPGGFPSHLNPGTPGAIHEGGELGYALATAFGAAFDNPDLVVACIIGDGEAETGPTATAWHGYKYLDPTGDGAVLPLLHVNDYKISSETIYGGMSDSALLELMRGYGYEPLLVEVGGNTQADYDRAHRLMAHAVEQAYEGITQIQRQVRATDRPAANLGQEAAAAPASQNPEGSPEHQTTQPRDDRDTWPPRWPMIVLRSPKGWTGIPAADGKPIEGSFRAHQVPLEDVRSNPEHLQLVETWLRSYHPTELFDGQGRPDAALLATCPQGEKRMGMNPHANGGKLRKDLSLPDFRAYACDIRQHGQPQAGDTTTLGKYLRDVIKANADQRNFRIVCPDEMTSNRLTAVFEATDRQFELPTNPADDYMGTQGRVMEILSEHTCQAWMQGYLLTGRHGLFPSYEAFISIVDSMTNQYAKFLKQASEIPWRASVSSFNYLLSSEGWRQDHNGYSHQGPGFINTLLNKKAANVRIYLPPDTNCLLSTMDHCLTSKDKINLVIASKQPMPQWLPMEEAIAHCRDGASVWRWASTDQGDQPDLVIASSGVYPTAEALACILLLRQEAPELRVRCVNVTDLLILELNSFHPHGLTSEAFDTLFTRDKPVLYNFHGYPSAVKQLLFDRPGTGRFEINGYIEEGTTTTPFSLLVANRVDRYHLLMQAVRLAMPLNPSVAARADALIARYEQKLADHKAYAEAHGDDPDEIKNWTWQD